MPEGNRNFDLFELSMAQIRNAMRASDKSVARLSENFIRVSILLDGLVEVLESSDNDGRDDGAGKVSSKIHAIREVMNDSMRAFQYHDRLNQRMDHVIKVLAHGSEVMTYKNKICSERVVDSILSTFTLADEKALLQSMYRGEEKLKQNEYNNEVELF